MERKKVSHACGEVSQYFIFEESFYRSHVIEKECHLSDNVPLLISFYMEIYLNFFQIYLEMSQTPKAPLCVCACGDKRSHEETRGTHPSVGFLTPY